MSLKLFVMDHEWAGMTVTLAKDQAQAIKNIRENHSWYSGFTEDDEIARDLTEHEIVDGFTHVNYGDA